MDQENEINHFNRPKEVVEWFKTRNKTVVTLLGYSGMGYENILLLEQQVQELLKNYTPSKTIVNIGATSPGIGQLYGLVKSLGFETTGIVSSLAEDYGETFSPDCSHVFVIKDTLWGGINPETQQYSPTSRAMIECSDVVAAFGGNEISRDEYVLAQQTGKITHYYPAETNHDLTLQRAHKKGQPAPAHFWGSLHDYLLEKGEAANPA